jgi:hypothetical protein
MKKRGQITVFFIVGIIILVGVVVGLLLNEYMFKSEAERQIEGRSSIPEKIRPVDNFLRECLTDVASDGLEFLGSQGGYLELPVDNMPTSRYAPLGRNLEVMPGYYVPLWFRERGNGIPVIEIPAKEEMELALGEFVSQRFISECLPETEDFVTEGFLFSTEATTLTTQIEIENEKTFVIVDFPLTIGFEDVSFTLENHQAMVDSSLGKLYDMAVDLMKAENEGYLLENKTIDMMIAYDPEIPYTGVDTECGGRIWNRGEVIENIRDALVVNTGMLKAKGSKYTLSDDKFKFMELELLESPDADTTVNFRFQEDWPLMVDITPSTGDLLVSESFGGQGNQYMHYLTQFVCVSQHNFVYDIKYPILISLRDENGEFQFATQVIIDNNEPRVSRGSIDSIINEYDSPVCDYATNELVVDTYTVSDAGNVVPLNDVRVSLKCTPVVCDIGEVKSSGRAILQAPSCVNGIVVGNKEGYYLAKEIVTVKEDIDIPEVKLVLKPEFELNVNLKIIEEGRIRDPYDSESAIFNFQSDDGYFVYYAYPEEPTIKLIPGDYKVESYIYGTSTWPITTQKRVVKNCVSTSEASLLGVIGLADNKKCFDFEIPSMEIDFAIKGGAKFDYKIYHNELAGTDEITLYVMAEPIASDAEGLFDVQNKIDLNVEDPSFRYPEL